MKLILISAAIMTGILSAGFINKVQNDPWPVPDKYKKMQNPVKSDAESLKTGKTLWVKHCQSCHGKSGAGDGSKAGQLKTDPGNFTKAEFHKQSDGSMYYKTLEGRDDMPSFKKKIADNEEIWSVVNYMRTFK